MALGDIFSNLTSAFTGKPFVQANQINQQALQGYKSQADIALENASRGSLGALQGGEIGALGALAPAVQEGQGYISQYAPQALGALSDYTGQAVNTVQGATPQALSALQSGVSAAQGAYAPLGAAAAGFGATGGQYTEATKDALGLNGPEGVARARSQFQNSPGFQGALDIANEQTRRQANASGIGDSGNTLRAIGEYSTNAALQDYNNYLNRLQGGEQYYNNLVYPGLNAAAGGIANAALTGGTGAANILTGDAGRAAGYYGQAAQLAPGIYTGAGSNLANLATLGGQGAANIFQQGGQAQSNVFGNVAGQNLGFLQGLVGPTVQGNQQAAAAQMQGGQNVLGAIGGLATLGVGLGGYGPFAPPFAPKSQGQAPGYYGGSPTGNPYLQPYG